ncbi:hypothetical protein N7539_000304 [Penicillium diatomitis]|uniref:FHA domain-containing protein n=1 Tax=Penicillium diatomitis TaxID=2819901 RepID=A0A9X0C220_9EURO|nr:uncharacterized protein N7539_000304 [Penicillium diatomitis]KAJ5495188.1 hypothetical protein N7539_000304 [Penicillium diatomitis]
MASTTDLAQDVGIRVGSLTLQHPDTQQVVTTVEVYSNIEVFVGRDAKRWRSQIHVASPFVSSRHVRIYTVVYDAGDLENVPPLVYAEDLSTNGTYWNSHVMRKGYASSLLCDGDTLEIAGHSQIQFKSAFASKGSQLTPLQQVEMEKFGDQYAVTPRLLGSGAFGKVYMAHDVKTGRQFACKVVDLEAVAAQARANLNEEEQSKFFARKSRLFAKIKRATKKTGKSKSPVMRQVEMQRQEALLLAGLSHVSLPSYYEPMAAWSTVLKDIQPNILRVERVFQSSKTM